MSGCSEEDHTNGCSVRCGRVLDTLKSTSSETFDEAYARLNTPAKNASEYARLVEQSTGTAAIVFPHTHFATDDLAAWWGVSDESGEPVALFQDLDDAVIFRSARAAGALIAELQETNASIMQINSDLYQYWADVEGGFRDARVQRLERIATAARAMFDNDEFLAEPNSKITTLRELLELP